MDGSRITEDRAKVLRRTMSLPEVLLWKAIKGGVDGASHHAGDRPVHDERRDAWLAHQGIATLRLPASLILRDVDDAVRMIAGYLQHGD